ncbi:hypothetical protein RFI_10874, partial [Reticulomyxa filosa]
MSVIKFYNVNRYIRTECCHFVVVALIASNQDILSTIAEMSTSQASSSGLHHAHEHSTKKDNENGNANKKMVSSHGFVNNGDVSNSDNSITNGTKKERKFTTNNNNNNNNNNANNVANQKIDSNNTLNRIGLIDEKSPTLLTPNGCHISQNEIIRVVMQCLNDLGYKKSAKCLSQESGLYYSEAEDNEAGLRAMETAISNGKWNELLEWFDSFMTMDAICVSHPYTEKDLNGGRSKSNSNSVVLISP